MTLEVSTNLQHLAQVLARRVIGGTWDELFLSSLAEDFLQEQSPPDAAPDKSLCLQSLIEIFLAVRGQLPLSLASKFLMPLSQILQRVAAQHGVASDEFNTALLVRILSEADPGSSASAGSKPTTKEKILDAALEVFSEKGFHVATVDEIAEHAGLGKGTVYRYFANKEALFNELVRSRLEDLEHSASSVLNSHDDVVTMIIKYLRVYFDFFDHNQRLYRVIVQEHLDFGNEMQELYIKKVLRRLPALKRKVYEATQQSVFKDLDFQTVFYGVMGFVHGVIQKWLAHDCSYSLMDELPTVVEILFFGFVKDQNRTSWQDLRHELLSTRAFS